jgi:hypothetical protein
VSWKSLLDLTDGVARLKSPNDIRVASVIGLLIVACSGALFVGLFDVHSDLGAYLLAGLAIAPLIIVLWRRRVIARQNKTDPPYFPDPDI